MHLLILHGRGSRRYPRTVLWLTTTAVAGTSQLFGEVGELWEAGGRLPDVSYAGYRGGEAIPRPATTTTVSGAADGVTDDHAVVQAALDAGGVVELGPGTWRIEDVLEVSDSVVLRGAGRDQTTVLFPNSLEELRGAAAQWSWNGGLIWVSPTSSPIAITGAGPAVRGDTFLPLDDTSGLSEGQLIELRLTDDDDRTLGAHFHDDLAEPGTCDWQFPLTHSWPVQIAKVKPDGIELVQPLRLDVRPEWTPTIREVPWIEEFGLEDLTIAFPDVDYAGHLLEPGYNGVFLKGGVANSWVRDVTFVNSDNAVLPDQLTKWMTVSGIRLEGRQGHHGFNVAYASDLLFTDVHWAQEHVHSFTVDHRASGNVLMESNAASGIVVTIDHHRDGAHDNVFTAIDAELSHFHGGSWCAGPPAGARETFWGNRGPLLPPYWGTVQANVIGDVDWEAELTEDGPWYEPVEDLTPPNLYLAQRAWRFGEVEIPDDETGDTAEPDDTDAPAPKGEAEGGCGCTTSSPSVSWLGWLRRR